MNKQRIAKILRTVLWAGIPASALLQELAVLISYDADAHYFATNAPLPVLANLLTALLFAATILSALLTPKPSDAPSPFGKQIWIAAPAALGFACAAIFLLLDFLGKSSALHLVAAILCALSAAHALLSETAHKITALGYFPPLACASLVCILYFDTSLEMNAPMKVAVQCALLPLMLYFTAELRYLLERDLPRLFVALAFCSLATSTLCLLTVPVASMAGRLENAYCLIAAIAVIGINATVALRQWRYQQAPAKISAPEEIPSPENDTKETDAQ